MFRSRAASGAQAQTGAKAELTTHAGRVAASVVVKWFVSASGAPRRTRTHRTQADGRVVQRLRGPQVLEALDALDAFFDSGVHLVAPDRELMACAAHLSRRCQLSAFDSAYAAVADTLGCALVTADRRLASALTGTVETRAIQLRRSSRRVVAKAQPDAAHDKTLAEE